MAATQSQIDRQSIVLAGCVAILNGTASASLLVRFAADLLRAGTPSTAEAIRRAAASALMSQIFAGTADAAYMARYGEAVQLALDILNLNINVDEDGNYSVPWEENFNFLPQDENGWSAPAPSADSRIVYVSNTGNDGTGEFYVYGDMDAAVGADPRSPAGIPNAYATVAAAYAQTRSGEADWILIECGGTWTIDPGEFGYAVNARAGKSVSERFVIASYGTGNRPLIQTGIRNGYGSANYSAIIGIQFLAHTRNPDDTGNFVGYASAGNPIAFNMLGNNMVSRFIEDCRFSHYREAVIISSTQSAEFGATDIIVRRSIITDNWSHDERSQGIFSWYSEVLLEENFFDHNGWYTEGTGNNSEANGAATIFNHNTYFENSNNCIFRRNIFMRPSSINNKWTANSTTDPNTIVATNLIMDGNIYWEGELGCSIGGNDDPGTGPRWENIIVVNNVFTAIGRGNYGGRDIGWTLEANDWDTGIVSNNIFCHIGESPDVTNVFALRMFGDTSGLVCADNIFFDIYTTTTAFGPTALQGNGSSGVIFVRNQLQNPGVGGQVLAVSNIADGTLTDNRYYSSAGAGIFNVNSTTGSNISTLNAHTGGDDTVEQISYVDDSVSMENYLTSISETATLANFVTLLKGQSAQTWDADLTASTIKAYFVAGFQEAA